MLVFNRTLSQKQEYDNLCCSYPILGEDQGFVVCRNCGAVFDPVYDNTPRRAFTQAEITARKSTEPVYSPIGPRTVIRGKIDSKGSLMSAQDQAKFSRLGKIHRSLTSSYERNLWIALPSFQCLQGKLALPQMVVKDAIRIYQNAVRAKLTMGRSIDTLMAASVFVSLKIHGIPRVIEEITQAMDVPKKNVVKSYRLLLMKILPQMNIRVKLMGPTRYIEKFGEDLLLPMNIRQDAIRLLRKAQKSGLLIDGKDPKGLASAALYICAHLHRHPRSQIEIANLAHITEVTLRVRCKDIKKFVKFRSSG
jgi:transcription initiation factor TFIIB